MKKSHNERSKLKDHEDIVAILINIKKFHVKQITKLGGISNLILSANGDSVDKDQIDYESIENAHYSAIAYGIPKFTGIPTNVPLNAVLFALKVYGYPICWNDTIPVD
ncbi:MAG: hypothetical protein EZS28_012028 [Streblomastix strix]|uniref:Uncharacterized protein n=1 Tax=Streblomastix strix TaxID=222440 RepID=A0A5J4WD39_9EUKA|nr:MAG: hypothetical protein EZS28_012028 [Streblomastix strix]